MIRISDLFDLNHTLSADYLRRFEYPWQALKGIGDMIVEIGEKLDPSEYIRRAENVWVHKNARVCPSAYLGAPCIIGANTEVRHCAFIRENALVGENCVVGNSVELKNAILFDGVQVPHFNYVGDSILGYKAHMGAGAITSNVKADQSPVEIRFGDASFPTGLEKVGAMLGDYAEIGCNSVLNPGSIVGRKSNVYPLSCVRGVIPEKSICKTGGVIVPKDENRR